MGFAGYGAETVPHGGTLPEQAAKPSKTTLYLAVGGGVLALILIVVVIIVTFSGGDPTATAGGAAVVATAAAAAAKKQRDENRRVVEAAKADTEAAAIEIKDNKDRADAAAEATRDEVAKMDDETLKNEGENLFGGEDDETDPGVPA